MKRKTLNLLILFFGGGGVIIEWVLYSRKNPK